MDQGMRLLEKEIIRLLKEKEEREAALPAHSIRPHQIIAIEELESDISLKEAQLTVLKKQRTPT